MYYHNSPTPKQLKAVKTAKAAEMKIHLESMKLVTYKYRQVISMLEQLRGMELSLENLISTGRIEGDELVKAQDTLERDRKKVTRMVAKLVPDPTSNSQ